MRDAGSASRPATAPRCPFVYGNQARRCPEDQGSRDEWDSTWKKPADRNTHRTDPPPSPGPPQRRFIRWHTSFDGWASLLIDIRISGDRYSKRPRFRAMFTRARRSHTTIKQWGRRSIAGAARAACPNDSSTSFRLQPFFIKLVCLRDYGFSSSASIERIRSGHYIGIEQRVATPFIHGVGYLAL